MSLFPGCKYRDNQYRIGEKYHPDGDVCTICMCGGFCESGHWCPQSNANVKGIRQF